MTTGGFVAAISMRARTAFGRSESVEQRPVTKAYFRPRADGFEHLIAAPVTSPQRRYSGNSSNQGLRNCNFLACVCVLLSTARRAQERAGLTLRNRSSERCG